MPEVVQRHAQDGLLGIAFHPGFLKASGPSYLYVVLTYDADPGPAEARRMALRRYTYDATAGTLGSPVELLTDLPAGDDHVGGRLVFGRDDKLYLSIGDQGFNQFGLYCQPIRVQELPGASEVTAQSWQRYDGKILRINLDGSIPADNPALAGVRSHIYSYGHRNPQGLAFAPDGKLYSSEHGPSMDDEVNLIAPGGNYGWPYVAGYSDDRVYVYANWSAAPSCSTLKFDSIVAPPSVPQQKESAWTHPDFKPPVQTFFTVGSDYRFSEQGNATIAPSGIDVYAVADGIPGWADSVLVTSLIRGVIYRVKLAPGGNAAAGEPLEVLQDEGAIPGRHGRPRWTDHLRPGRYRLQGKSRGKSRIDPGFHVPACAVSPPSTKAAELIRRALSLADNLKDDLPPACRRVELEQHDLLPCAEQQLPVSERHGKRRTQ